MNKVILIARLTKDPELRYAPNGTAIVNFTAACDRNMSKEKKAEAQAKGGQTADFPRIMAFGKTAELCANYLSKGKQVAIEGHIQTSTYKTQAGETRYSTDVIADKIEFVGNNSEAGPKNEPMSGGGSEEYNQNDFASIEDLEEDIPF